MTTKREQQESNILTIDGKTFKTQGNIVFTDQEESDYYLAEGSHLKEMDTMLEHGMRMLLNKVKI